ncbi:MULTISPECIES: GNAT family N-acetyltransferase [Micrococcaceae]|uniref:GNAT family N-acetyltransferase n=1 Tax=Micrococcaceae TaxID=1268 RepID=UPI001036C424|nr:MULTISPECIES: GNAT family N-acetyltransferase [Micrococcaceae]TAP25086.1 GNAT family N-acetyltransferase [Arthrobacter sp. S41]UXN32064.1 GNAT family N-acetyltransferase [Glutamicibacter sp. M10]
MSVEISIHKPEDLSTEQLYALLKLRTHVFIVEQRSSYPDLDGLDLVQGTLHLGAWEDGDLLCTVRILDIHGENPHIGRVATKAEARGRGLAGTLMKQAVFMCRPDVQIHLGAQTQLEDWYGKFGFERCGEDFDDDGIMHLPMIRRAATASA